MEQDADSEWANLPTHLRLDVRLGPVPEELPGAQRPTPWLHVTSREVLVDFGDDTRLRVREGREVTLQLDESAQGGDPSWLLQGWAVTIAALQRGNLSLHAATVRIGDAVVAIAGDRGAGKSTTAVGLRNRGHQLLVDDVSLLEFRGIEAWMTPYARNVHLLPDAADALGIDFAALPPLALGRDKAAFRTEDPPIEPHRLDHIVVLDPRGEQMVRQLRPSLELPGGSAQDGLAVAEVRGAARVGFLVEHTVRDGLAPLVLGQEAYFSLLARLANAAPVHAVRRPATGWSLSEVLDAIEGIAAGVARA